MRLARTLAGLALAAGLSTLKTACPADDSGDSAGTGADPGNGTSTGTGDETGTGTGDTSGAATSTADGETGAGTTETDGGTGDTGDGTTGPAVPEGCENPGTPGATARCLTPKQTPAYYIEQSLKYFDTLDVEADPASIPNYSDLVARWEWPPWLKLTAFDRDTMNSTAEVLRQFDPSTVPVRDCRAFDVQPFGRCTISFKYEEPDLCPIYEEFVFNDQGEITFIEAWSDLPGLVPNVDPADRWAEGPEGPMGVGVHRLSTRVPGLGNATGRIDLRSTWMRDAEAADPEVADFAMRARDQWKYWRQELSAAGDDLYARGCGWK